MSKLRAGRPYSILDTREKSHIYMCDFRRVLSIEYWVSSRLDTQRPYSILNTRWKSHIFMCDFRRVLSIEYRRRASSRNSILNVETRYSILEKNRTLTWAIFVEYRVLSSHVECRVLDTQSQYSILDENHALDKAGPDLKTHQIDIMT